MPLKVIRLPETGNEKKFAVFKNFFAACPHHPNPLLPSLRTEKGEEGIISIRLFRIPSPLPSFRTGDRHGSLSVERGQDAQNSARPRGVRGVRACGPGRMPKTALD